ncbi:asparaginase [Saccharopolyspora mangrovi]|uniref:asparaginase n=1 Tax=Saccharopolyspora mangrovi TaxID=3082379 RepID=A0ABU6AJY6_9PSEU|nr:asparaginase [Saccharopolyspora sp. S2-29]MEB3371777.1 asparaginase [Saccharopolyspora sp. S2-29]
MQHLALLGTGGTIATRSTPNGRRVEVGAAELLGAAKDVWALTEVDIDTRDLTGVTSFAATIPDVLALVEAVQAAATGADGVVVTHGTDSLEETAFLLALAHAGPQPVVLTGAQRPFDDPAPDGPRNLAAALRWAAEPQAQETGVTVVFGNEVLPAVGVRKTHTLALQAFSAPGRSPIGHVDEAGVRVQGVAPRVPLLPPGTTDLPRVDIAGQYLGADTSSLHHAVANGMRGLVVAGFGSGNTTPETTQVCLRLLSDGIPVLITSRTGAGPVAGLYAGGSADLAAAGAVFAGDLSPWQARLLLAAALSGEQQPDQVARRCLTWLRDARVVSPAATSS